MCTIKGRKKLDLVCVGVWIILRRVVTGLNTIGGKVRAECPPAVSQSVNLMRLEMTSERGFTMAFCRVVCDLKNFLLYNLP